MLRCLIAVILASGAVHAALLPESFAGFQREGAPVSAALDPADRALWDEYGLTAAETATYASGTATLTVTAWKLKDPTGAYAVHQWLGSPAVFARDNYVIRIEGGRLSDDKLRQLSDQFPDRVRTSLPPLSGKLPAKNKVPGSERYLLGNISLNRFAPSVPAELAGLDRGAEAATATYRTRSGQKQLTVISYPTPQMAAAFGKQFATRSGLAVQRSGPLMAVVPVEGKVSPAVQDLLSAIEYRPNLTWNEYVSKDTPQDAARMILAIFMLAGILIVSSLVLGLFFGGSRVLSEKLGFKSADQGLTSLHLGNE